MLRPLRWLMSLFAKLFRAVLGFTSAGAGVDVAYQVSARAVVKMLVAQGVATREFAPPDDAYLVFDYRFSPFYGRVAPPESGAPSAAPANASVRWLRWADAPPLTDLEVLAA